MIVRGYQKIGGEVQTIQWLQEIRRDDPALWAKLVAIVGRFWEVPQPPRDLPRNSFKREEGEEFDVIRARGRRWWGRVFCCYGPDQSLVLLYTFRKDQDKVELIDLENGRAAYRDFRRYRRSVVIWSSRPM